MKAKGLTGNQLKLIALVAMTIDHIGLLLLPQYKILRIIGRLAYPIFGYMIAEGCCHTGSMGRYFGTMAAAALACQIAYLVTMGSLYQSIFVTFSLSIGVIFLLHRARTRKRVADWALVIVGIIGVLFVTEILPLILVGTDYGVEYGFLGVMLPVAVYLGRTKAEKLVLTALVLTAMGWVLGAVQWFALLALPLLMGYNGSRGKWKLKYLFYIYYPAHLAVLQLLVWLK